MEAGGFYRKPRRGRFQMSAIEPPGGNRMNWIAEGVERVIIAAMLRVFVLGGAVTLGGFLLIRWLVHHVHIFWR